MRGRVVVAAMSLAAALGTAGLSAQASTSLRIVAEDGSVEQVAVSRPRGYSLVRAEVLTGLGWSHREIAGSHAFSAPSGVEISLRPENPLFTFDRRAVQLSFPPVSIEGELWIPVQLLVDFLPQRFPELYAFDGPTNTLRAGPPPGGDGSAGGGDPGVPAEAESDRPEPSAQPRSEPSGERDAAPAAWRPQGAAPEQPGAAEVRDGAPPVRVVIIDAGHGGVDPGAIGVSGVREKAVALGISRALAERLRTEGSFEVHMLRDDDTFIELWDRGQMATDIRADRPAVLISIHANSFPQVRTARGFETYFLSEARTEHERRVAAMENAPVSMSGDGSAPSSELDFIFRELRNHDHQHWAEALASTIQEELEKVHPGPNRGVKQAPLAVLTNSLMPSVLVEIGYLSHPDEERTLSRASFQEEAADAMAVAVHRFFERYPPGSGGGSGTQR